VTNVLVPPAAEPLVDPSPAKSGRSRGSHPVVRFFARRLVGALATLIAVSMLIFFTLNVLPGDVASNILGRSATPEALASLRAKLGLDRSVWAQYFDWIGGVLHGDLGRPATAVAQGNLDTTVWSSISTPLVNSIYLAGIAVVLLIPLGMFLGALAAVRARKMSDHVISVTALTFGAMPEFLTATLLVVVFFSWLDVLPPIVSIAPGESPLAHPDALILPVATLLAVSLAFTIRMVRAGTIEALQQDYVAMARLNGVGERRVLWRYGLRNALAPSIQAIAQTITYLAGGIIITEAVFNYPGIGRALIQAVNGRDVATVAAITLILATFYVVINIIADFIVVMLVPKLRTSL
jgi:peptide/nickel transport system permease protein